MVSKDSPRQAAARQAQLLEGARAEYTLCSCRQALVKASDRKFDSQVAARQAQLIEGARGGEHALCSSNRGTAEDRAGREW